MRMFLLSLLLLSSHAIAREPLASFKAADADGDGVVSAAEHAGAAKKMFDAMDRNRDGKVTAQEMDRAQPKVAGKKADQAAMRSADKIKLVDRDGDGALARTEHEQASKALFAKMDADGDGRVSEAEWKAGHAALQKKN
jgi:Ca2+-binding EF-hand superfamily protein